MRYFIDTEFIERFHKPLFGKPRHVIDLISIGIVAEDGREYSAISNEYRYQDASPWVRENVIDQLYCNTVHGDARNHETVKTFHKYFGKPNKQIAEEIYRFVNPIVVGSSHDPLPVTEEYMRLHNTKRVGGGLPAGSYQVAQPEFFGYFADYDWVLLCSLFGTMMDLPDGFPMYCIDLKQMVDGKVKARYKVGNSRENFDKALEHFKSHPAYPADPTYKHSAIADARWNRDLYNFLMF